MLGKPMYVLTYYHALRFIIEFLKSLPFDAFKERQTTVCDRLSASDMVTPPSLSHSLSLSLSLFQDLCWSLVVLSISWQSA